MESTWASGAIELLRHADSHIGLKTAFDKRIAFISIDNSVEIMIRSYLSLPRSKSGIKVSRKELDEASNSFPSLVGLLYSHASDKLVGIDAADVEHYHRIRNTLYHEGTGLSVDDQYLMAYSGIAGVLLQNLFGSSVGPSSSAGPGTLERLIVNWNNIEQIVRDRTEAKGVFTTQIWEKAVAAGLSDDRDLQLLDDLHKARNRLVHSSSIKKEDLVHWINASEELLKKLSESTQATETAPPANVALTYKKIGIDADLHRYSLVVSVTLNKTPDQGFFRLVILWPLDVRGMRASGFKQGEEQQIEGHRYLELPLDVQERLWPGQTMKIVGGRTGAQIEYTVDDATFERLHEYSADVHYALYLQDWHPVRGKVPFEELNEF